MEISMVIAEKAASQSGLLVGNSCSGKGAIILMIALR